MMGFLGRWIDRLEERRAARAWRLQHDRATKRWLASERFAQIKACGHADRRPNPGATAVISRGDAAEVCNDCGIGIVTVRRLR